MKKPFTARRIVRTTTIELAASANRVFPLFEPIGEKQWAGDWDPQMIYPPSGVAEAGAVFAVPHAGGSPAIWTIVRYDPGRFQIAYVRVEPATHVARIDIACAETPDGATRADITYTFTALTERGNAYVDTFTEQHYRAWIASWATAINHFLRHGVALPPHA